MGLFNNGLFSPVHLLISTLYKTLATYCVIRKIYFSLFGMQLIRGNLFASRNYRFTKYNLVTSIY